MGHKTKPPAGEAGGSENIARAAAQGNGPHDSESRGAMQGHAAVIVTMTCDRVLLLRWFADRRAIRRALKRRGRDEVTFVEVPGGGGVPAMRVELSMHDGHDEAEAAAREAMADLELAATPTRGRG